MLNQNISPPRENITISVESLPSDELVPTEDNIGWAVRRMRSNCSRGPSWTREEHLQQYLKESWKVEETAASYDTLDKEMGEAETYDPQLLLYCIHRLPRRPP